MSGSPSQRLLRAPAHWSSSTASAPLPPLGGGSPAAGDDARSKFERRHEQLDESLKRSFLELRDDITNPARRLNFERVVDAVATQPWRKDFAQQPQRPAVGGGPAKGMGAFQFGLTVKLAKEKASTAY